MLTLNDGRKELYQWDTGRTATVNVECDTVHFSNLKYGNSLPVEVKEGKVAIPNQLLLNGAPLYCWAFATDNDGEYTKKEQTIEVIKRAKPADYVYTETEVITIQNAVENALQEAKESGDFKGEKGDPFTYEDFTEEQLASLKGEDGADGKDAVTDQTYNPKSENAQSGKAVAEALEGFAGGGNGSSETWEVISDTTTEFENPVSQITITQDMNGNSFSLKKMKVFIDFTVAEAYTKMVRARAGEGMGFMYINSQNLSADTVYGYMIDSEVLPMVNNRCSMISHFNDNRMIEGGNNFDFTYNGGALDYGIRNQKMTVTTLNNVTGIRAFDFLLSADGKINKARVLILGVKE